MLNNDNKTGSKTAFDLNWKSRKESFYNHWVSGIPKNQIQLAFRCHWLLFREMLPENSSMKSIEIGCGRGSISSYFAYAGYQTTLLDISETVIKTAREIFRKNNHEHKAYFLTGDAYRLPFKDSSYDVAVSIGLLEHFENVAPVIHEQVRILRPGGRFLGYIVPERPDNVQKNWRWLNKILKMIAAMFGRISKSRVEKEDIYRSDYGSEHYIKSLENIPVQDIEVYGMYPLPMISHSPEFPFSLLPAPLEWILARIFNCVLAIRRVIYGHNPWICKEQTGQAFLLTFVKSEI